MKKSIYTVFLEFEKKNNIGTLTMKSTNWMQSLSKYMKIKQILEKPVDQERNQKKNLKITLRQKWNTILQII